MRLILTPLLIATLFLAACARPPAEEPVGSYSQKDFECLREAIYFEARASDPIGQHAVADVIKNRAEDPRFPNSICGVIAEGQAKGRCQFSYRCDARGEEFHDQIKFTNATRIAEEALKFPQQDITDGALYFHSTRMAPGWFGTLVRTGVFGGHVFYKIDA